MEEKRILNTAVSSNVITECVDHVDVLKTSPRVIIITNSSTSNGLFASVIANCAWAYLHYQIASTFARRLPLHAWCILSICLSEVHWLSYTEWAYVNAVINQLFVFLFAKLSVLVLSHQISLFFGICVVQTVLCYTYIFTDVGFWDVFK